MFFFCDVHVGLKDGLLELSALSRSYWRRTAVCELGGWALRMIPKNGIYIMYWNIMDIE